MTIHCRNTKPSFFGARLRIFAALCTLPLLLACEAATFRGSTPGPDVASRDVIAIMDRSAPTETIKAAANARGYQLVTTTGLPTLGKILLTFQTPETESGQDAIAYLEAADPAAAVGVNHAYRLQVDEAPFDPKTYAQTLMDWPQGSCKAQISVGLIDTMINSTAPALNGARVVSRDFARAETNMVQHGTDVASVLADARRLSDLTIYSAGVMTSTSDGGMIAGADALIRALEWLASQNVQVVNMSLAGPSNKILKIAIDEAAARGMILVASVGNFGANAGPFYPAAFDPVIAVTAVDASAQVYRKAVRGDFVDVAAPGVDIFVPTDQGGRFVTGTSFAAAFVTARIAADPRLASAKTAADVRALLADTSDDLGPTGFDRTYGVGLLKGPINCE